MNRPSAIGVRGIAITVVVAAIVFSSSLLHEALHVASGRRLVLLAFLFGDG
jgi:hypothetical protein